MEEKISLVNIPQLSVNDLEAELIEWYVADEDEVSSGQILCTIETPKVIYDVESEASGYIIHLANAGSDVNVNQPIALIGPNIKELRKEKEKYLSEIAVNSEKKQYIQGEIKATKKAIKRARELDIDLAEISKNGIIREKDVENFVLKSKKNIYDVQKEWVVLPNQDEPGYIDQKFLDKIENDQDFKNLNSDRKIDLYREKGAQIGKNVKIDKGSIIFSKVIRISDSAEINADSFIRTARFVLGKMSVIGKGARIVTREVIIGDMLFSGENIIIGGGGAFGPRSRLKVGDNCMISSKCVLNTGEPIIIGDEVGFSPNVQLYTHNHWQNVLKGYIARHAQIIIEDGSYITANCLIVPGVKIGKGATVLANSTVTVDVEQYTVVSGVPARMVSKINTNLKPEKKDRIMKRLSKEMKETLKFYGFIPELVEYKPKFDCNQSTKYEVILTFEPKNLPSFLEKPVIFDLTSFHVFGTQTRLSDEVRNFLRRRGIRFKPIYWRYIYDKGYYIQ